MVEDIEDVNKAIADLQKQLDYKANLEELKTVVNDQALINESICTENIVGRWAWKSGNSEDYYSMSHHITRGTESRRGSTLGGTAGE